NCYDAIRFSRLWTNTMPYSAGALPALHENVLYVPGQDAIYCYDAADGTLLGTDSAHWGGMLSQCSWSNTLMYEDLMIFTNGRTVTALRMSAHLLR
ncbi:MAG: PQQ-binding-like beta-propeller repeat protein, partial [Bacillota bacterium]|nr:PQQ-binding-like beta-propeller repeat protein [Bacillota bacterium]